MYKAVIVDDEPFVVEGLKHAIDWSGYNFELCLCTTDPRQALAYLEQHSADLLVTDISMPQMDGIELIRRTREQNSLISVLVLSAYDNFEYVRSAMRHGAENYLLKPLDPNELAESISRIAAHLQERAAISGAYGSAMLTFRSSFIENWVKDGLGEDEFITRAQMLGVNLYLDNYSVLIFSAPPSLAGGKAAMSRLFDYLLSQFVGAYISHFYFETPLDLVCVLSSADALHPLSWLLERLDMARRTLDFPFFVSVGNTVDTFDQVGASYRSADKFLFLRFTSVRQVLCSRLSLSPAGLRSIREAFGEMTEETCLTAVPPLLSKIPKSQRLTAAWELISVAFELACPDGNPAPDLERQLAALLPGPVLEAPLLPVLLDFVQFCLRAAALRQAVQTATFPCVDACIAAVHEFSDKDLSLKTLAARLNMHPSYLGNVFHQQTGYYFNDYLNEERMKYAARLIETTDMKLKDIVERIGFSSQTYFNRQFRRRFGAAPSAYRRDVKMKH